MSKSESLIEAWKRREDYIKDIKDHPLYNIWRAFRFTIKGKKIGNSIEWDDFRIFYNDIITIYEPNKRFSRIDKNKPFQKDNVSFVIDVELSNNKVNTILLEYNNEKRSLLEWSIILNRSLAGIRNRYHKYDNYTDEEILLGKQRIIKRLPLSIEELTKAQIRTKASKMVSAYRIKDIRRRFDTDIDVEWLIENILSKECIYCGSKGKVGCDRIDNTIGHIKSNIVPCCTRCNTVRSNFFTVDEMKKIGIPVQCFWYRAALKQKIKLNQDVIKYQFDYWIEHEEFLTENEVLEKISLTQTSKQTSSCP
jgi:hypothetical protein